MCLQQRDSYCADFLDITYSGILLATYVSNRYDLGSNRRRITNAFSYIRDGFLWVILMLDRKYFFDPGRYQVGASRWHRCAFVKPSIEQTVTIQTHYSTRIRKYIRDCVQTSLKVFTNNSTGRNNRANNSACGRSVIVYTAHILELVFSVVFIGPCIIVFFFWSNATTCSYELSWFPSWLWR